MQGQQFADGATVYDTAGEKIGTLRGYDPQGGYLMVEKGWLFPKDCYVPLTEVRGSDSNGDIHLSLHKDDLQADRYDNPPVAGTIGAGDYGQTITTQATTAQARPAPVTPHPTATASADDTIVVPEYEEQLVVGKRQEQIGDVHVHKDVVTEQETVPVTLEQEHVTVERVPVSGQGDVSTADAFQEQDIEVPVMGEEAVVGKQARAVEEVRLRKQAITEQQQVSDTVRKERVVVDPPNADVDTLPNPTTLEPRH